jgi:hypothetical protein
MNTRAQEMVVGISEDPADADSRAGDSDRPQARAGSALTISSQMALIAGG